MSNKSINFIGWILFIISAIGFCIASIGSFWSMFGSLFFLIACVVFLIPYFRNEILEIKKINSIYFAGTSLTISPKKDNSLSVDVLYVSPSLTTIKSLDGIIRMY